MYKESTILGIVTARSGSKGLPGKNIKELCGKPLLAWTIQSGLASRYIDELMVTTDSQEIADIANEYGASTPFLRPLDLANDEATSASVVKHAIEFLQDKLEIFFDYILLLEPTSPLREPGDIDGVIEKLINNRDLYDSIVTVGEVHDHPSSIKKITSTGYLKPYCVEAKKTSRRQDDDAAYAPYGGAYAIKRSVFLKEKTFYTNKTGFYQIQRHQCYEIDDIYDFFAVESILKSQRVAGELET